MLEHLSLPNLPGWLLANLQLMAQGRDAATHRPQDSELVDASIPLPNVELGYTRLPCWASMASNRPTPPEHHTDESEYADPNISCHAGRLLSPALYYQSSVQDTTKLP